MPASRKETAETKRLRQIIDRAAVALKDSDLHLMTLDYRSLTSFDRNALDRALGGLRAAREILAEP